MLQYKKGETLYAFNFAKKAIKENKKVIFCEGYMDCIAYHQCGIEYAVAPLGTALTEEQIKIIQPFCDEVLLSFDSDGAGQKATERAIYMLRRNNITVKIIKLSLKLLLLFSLMLIPFSQIYKKSQVLNNYVKHSI